MARNDDRQGEISFLQFWFFKHAEASPIKIKLPFIENIVVSESQKANFSKYQPIGRAGSLFTYTGSESRRLKISFNLTFDNVDNYRPSTPQQYMGGDIWDETQFFDEPKELVSDSYTAFSSMLREQSDNERDDNTTQIIMYWVNLVRSSVLNNAEDPTLPPPLIRLNHGTMYRNIPCICHSYSVSHEENAGYERASFLPRRVKISMDLSEVRLDQINSAESVIKDTSVLTEILQSGSDKLKGWESIIRGESLDPVQKITKTIKEPLPLGSTDLPNSFNELGGLA